MSIWSHFWKDTSGAIVSAELIAVSTLGVLGGTAGLSMLGTSANGEYRELSHAVRSLNQSYSVPGHQCGLAWTAGSCYTQQDVKISLEELDAEFVGDRAEPRREEPRKRRKKRDQEEEKRDQERGAVSESVTDEAAFLQPAESAVGEPDLVAPEDDASQMETVIEAAPEA